MMIHDITEKVGPHKRRKRIGRGEGSGFGGTSGRGHKGAKSRSGYKRRASYEGGQRPFFQRFPKRGFSNANFRKYFHVVNVKVLEELFDAGTEIDCAILAKKGVVRDTTLPPEGAWRGRPLKEIRCEGREVQRHGSTENRSRRRYRYGVLNTRVDKESSPAK